MIAQIRIIIAYSLNDVYNRFEVWYYHVLSGKIILLMTEINQVVLRKYLNDVYNRFEVYITLSPKTATFV